MSKGEYAKQTGDWIRETRTQLGMTQAEVAEGVNLSVASISNWEKGTANISSHSHTQLRSFFKSKMLTKKGVMHAQAKK